MHVNKKSFALATSLIAFTTAGFAETTEKEIASLFDKFAAKPITDGKYVNPPTEKIPAETEKEVAFIDKFAAKPIADARYVDPTTEQPKLDSQCPKRLSGLFVTGDLLFWRAMETGLAYAVKSSICENLAVTSTRGMAPPVTRSAAAIPAGAASLAAFSFSDKWKIKEPDFDYDLGFRVGLGYNMPYDDWDAYLNWTRFRSTARGHQSVCHPSLCDLGARVRNGVLQKASGRSAAISCGSHTLLPIWIDPESDNEAVASGIITKIPFLIDAKARWRLHFDLLELDLGRNIFVTKWLTLRPFFGLCYAWIFQKFDVDYVGLEQSFTPGSGGLGGGSTAAQIATFYDIDMRNNFRGVGINGGIDSKWNIFREVSIFADIDIDLLYGRFGVHQKSCNKYAEFVSTTKALQFPTTLDAANISLRKDYEFRAVRAILDFELGVRWDHDFCNGTHLKLQIGWEEMLLWGQNQLMQFFADRRSSAGSGAQANPGTGDFLNPAADLQFNVAGIATSDIVFGNFVAENGDLSFEGLTFEIGLDF